MSRINRLRLYGRGLTIGPGDRLGPETSRGGQGTVRETTYTNGLSGSDMFITTSWVGAGFFCLWVKPYTGRGR